MTAPCDCSLEATADRLAHGLSEDDRARLRELENADPNGPLFEAHMQFEEQVLAPNMKPGDAWKLKAEHAVIRRARAAGLRVNDRFFASHAAWEKKIFPTLGRARRGVAP